MEKIDKEVTGLPEDIGHSLVPWEVSDVYSTYQHLSEVVKSIEALQLIKKEFEISE